MTIIVLVVGFMHLFTYKKGPGADSYQMALRDNRITQRPLNFFQGMNTSLTKKKYFDLFW